MPHAAMAPPLGLLPLLLWLASHSSGASAEEVIAASSGANTFEVLDLLGVTDEAARNRIQAAGDDATDQPSEAGARRWAQTAPARGAGLGAGATEKVDETSRRWGQTAPARRVDPQQVLPPWQGEAGGSAAADLPEALANNRFCNMQRIPAAEFTRERFIREFEGRQPFVLTGATDGWGALQWEMETLHAQVALNAARMSQSGVPTSKAAAGFTNDLEVMFAPGEALAQRTKKLVVDGYALAWPGLRAGYSVPEFAVRDGHQNFIAEWRSHAAEFADMIPVLQGRAQDPGPPSVPVQDRYLITGPRGAGGFPHTDVSNQSFWNTLVHGRKRWFFLSAAHRERLLMHDPTTVASWSTVNTTAYSWFTDGWAQKIAGGWGSGGGPAAAELAGTHWWECYQDPGDLVFGAGGMMHAVLSLDDTLSVSEQMLGPTDFRGSISFGRALSGGLIEAGWCDSSIESLQIQNLEQLLALGSLIEMASFKGPMTSLNAAEIAEPSLRKVERIERVFLVVDWFASCSALWKVRRDLWEGWDECAALADSCEGFVGQGLGFRDEYDWYPEIRRRSGGSKGAENKGKRGKKKGKRSKKGK